MHISHMNLLTAQWNLANLIGKSSSGRVSFCDENGWSPVSIMSVCNGVVDNRPSSGYKDPIMCCLESSKLKLHVS